MNPKIFGRNLLTILEHKRMTKSDLWRRTGISKAYISGIIEGAKRNISEEYRSRLAKGMDLSLDMIDRLGDPEIKDPIALITGKPQSLIVPFLFNFSSLTPDTINAVRKITPEDLKTIPDKKFISFPKCPPFNLMNNFTYIAISVDIDTGMSPKIEPGDVLTVNLDDTTPEEKKIYLIQFDKILKFRYAKLQTIRNRNYMRLWAEDRSLGEDVVDLQIVKTHPILGNIRTHTRML